MNDTTEIDKKEKCHLKSFITATRILDDKIIEKLMKECRTKKEFIWEIKDYATLGYLIPLAVLQFCYK